MRELPARLTSLVGRDHDADEARDLILHATERLVTLTGVGGCGKTQLALRVAADARESFRDGVCLVELAAVSDATLVPHAVLTALGLAESPNVTPLESLIATLSARDLLLVLDNCEHLIDACASLAERLLSACPSLRILATSREPLQIPGERQRRVQPLAVPDLDAPGPIDELVHCPSVQLFTERAQAVAAPFRLSDANLDTVARICARLEGIPLALELAATRVRVLSVDQILERLDDCFRVLTGGHRTAPTRQQTMQAALDWSYDLLSEPERAVFRRLAVFAGGCDLEAIEAVGAGDPVGASDVLDVLTRLVDKSMVRTTEDVGAVRFGLLEPVRQYAARCLAACGEADVVRTRHTTAYLDLAEDAARALRGPDQVAWLSRLEKEQGNLRAVLRRVEESGDVETSLRLGTALAPFWEVHCHLSEGRRWLDRAIDRSRTTPVEPTVRFWAQCAVGRLAYAQARYDEAVALHDQALAGFRARGDQRGIATALTELGMDHRLLRHLERSMLVLEQSLALFQELGDRPGMALALLNLGITRRIQGEVGRSRQPLEESLALYRGEGDRRMIAIALAMLGWTRLEQGDHREAAGHFAEALASHREVGDRFFVILDLFGVAAVLLARSRPSDAARLLAATRALGELPGDSLSYVGKPMYDSLLAAVRSRLSEAELRAAWGAGHTLSLDQAVSVALALANDSDGPDPASASPGEPSPAPDPLTRREREVAALIAQGWHSNRAIADRLTIAEGTAGVHVQRVLTKLGLHSRWQIGEWAAKQDPL